MELDADLETELRRIGTGRTRVGPTPRPTFAEPQGLAVLPPERRGQVGYDVVVADSVNHALRGVRLADGAVSTAGRHRRQLRAAGRRHRAAPRTCRRPWDVAWFDGQVVVAMAGMHQLWAFDPLGREGRGCSPGRRPRA